MESAMIIGAGMGTRRLFAYQPDLGARDGPSFLVDDAADDWPGPVDDEVGKRDRMPWPEAHRSPPSRSTVPDRWPSPCSARRSVSGGESCTGQGTGADRRVGDDQPDLLRIFPHLRPELELGSWNGPAHPVDDPAGQGDEIAGADCQRDGRMDRGGNVERFLGTCIVSARLELETDPGGIE